MANYGLLIKAAGRALRPRGKLTTVALHPLAVNPEMAASSAFSLVHGSADRVHLMAYDFRGEGAARGNHAALGDSALAVKYLVAARVPPAKIVLGIPAYGRHLVH